ncbi:bcl-2-like protein 2 [Centruroides sculpturatus]|uniref:bcl-2-like protein 2 n=1 Tax=Centruroides sculpturatus TaxID=218467 RepID=UPI000C6E4CDE|nr:bcl-2-like protein 2 [Centruroides sculpturatus]
MALSVRLGQEMEVNCIVNDYISYYLQMNGYEWGSVNATPSKVNSSLRSLANDFKTKYPDRILKMTNDLNIHPSNACPILLGVSNELFSDGVTWTKIVAFFVFASEMALICHRYGSDTKIVNDVAEWSTSYIKSNLLMWITCNGGWNNLVTYFEQYHAI